MTEVAHGHARGAASRRRAAGAARAPVGGHAPWALWGLAVLGLVVAAWCNQLLRRAGRSDLAQPARSAP